MATGNAGNQWKTDVQVFLDRFKYAVEFQPALVTWPGSIGEWAADLGDLGLTHQLALEAIKEDLTSAHLQGELQEDHWDASGRVGVFRLPLAPGTDAYVKLGLKPHPRQPNSLIRVVWSFKRWT